MSCPSVVVDDFDIFCTSVLPNETDPPLVIDADTVLALSVTLELFQAIARWDAEIFDRNRCVEQLQFSKGSSLHPGIHRFDKLFVPDAFSAPVAERSDHTTSVCRYPLITLVVKPDSTNHATVSCQR